MNLFSPGNRAGWNAFLAGCVILFLWRGNAFAEENTPRIETRTGIIISISTDAQMLTLKSGEERYELMFNEDDTLIFDDIKPLHGNDLKVGMNVEIDCLSGGDGQPSKATWIEIIRPKIR